MVKQYTQVYPVTVTVPESSPIGATLNGNITVDISSNTSEKIVQVPNTQSWTISDLYSTYTSSSAPDTDGSVSVVKNSNFSLYQSDPISALGVSNPSRPTLPYLLGFNPGDRLQAKLIILAAASTTATQTDTFYIKVQITDYSL